jgi:hypothetical protein
LRTLLSAQKKNVATRAKTVESRAHHAVGTISSKMSANPIDKEERVNNKL